MEKLQIIGLILGVVFAFSLCLGKCLLYFGEDPESPLLKSLATIMCVSFLFVIGIMVMLS